MRKTGEEQRERGKKAARMEFSNRLLSVMRDSDGNQVPPMYEVMARRYRPATFDAVVGQEHIALTLTNAISRDRVAHAFIFTGGHGCGKTTMARILAKALVCEAGPTPTPCGVCNICRDVAAGRDADVLEIDGASNNGIEQIRQLREQAAYVPTRARFKIYIIDEVHMLSDGAFNALLKTLEEPPRHVKFILATTDPHKVPDTILSRCQRFDFRLVPPAKLSAFFRQLAASENAAITDDALDAVAAFAEGSVRDGLVLLDQLLSFADGEVTREDVESVRGVASAENVAGIFEAIAASDIVRALAIVDEVAGRGTAPGDFLDQLIVFGRDLMVVAATGRAEGVSVYGPGREALLRLAGVTSLEAALLNLDVLAQARTRVRTRALSSPMVPLEMAVARLAGLAGVTPVAEILAKLAELPVAAASPAQSPAPLPATSQAAAPTAPSPLPLSRAVEQGRAAEQKKTPDSAPAPEPKPESKPEPVPESKPELPPVQKPKPAPASAPIPEQKQAPASASAPALVAERLPAPEAVPPPEPESALQAARQLTQPAVAARWTNLLDAIQDGNPADLRHMARVVLDSVEDGKIILAAPSAVAEMWEDRHRRARLGEAIRRTFGPDAEFGFVVRAAPALVSAATSASASAANAEAGVHLTRHPAVEKVKSLFDGVVVGSRSAGEILPQDEAGGDEAEED